MWVTRGTPKTQLHCASLTRPVLTLIEFSFLVNTDSVVQVGTNSGQYSQSVSGTSWTYSAGVDGWIGWIHSVRLTGLTANTRYYYRVGSPNSVWGQEYSFKTPPVPGSGQSNTFAVFGDMGTYVFPPTRS
jgi:phosphodiesterase/alkaline phosphatase D-like protein